MYLFTGFRDHRIDGKDRIVVPTAYATAIQEHGEGLVYLVPGVEGRYLEAYPGDVFRQMSSGQVPSRFDGAQQDKRVFYQNVEKAPLKGPGRITLPKRFLEYFPKGVVRVCGMNAYLELWDPDLWEREVGRRAAAPAPRTGPGSKG
jgi:DNA-binding transcriptional regulator/RsmH inhibitor MraZ